MTPSKEEFTKKVLEAIEDSKKARIQAQKKADMEFRHYTGGVASRIKASTARSKSYRIK